MKTRMKTGRYMQKVYPFRNFADLCLKNHPFSLISRIRAYLWKITPFFAKVGTSVIYVLVGRGGGGGRGHMCVCVCACVCVCVCVGGGGGGGGDIRAILIKNVGGTAYDNIFSSLVFVHTICFHRFTRLCMYKIRKLA